MSTIKENIIAKRDEIIDNGTEPGTVGHDLAEILGRQATTALLNGKNSPEWRDFMKNFASNKAQLLRLMHRDESFNSNDWSSRAITYITSNPLCTTTTLTGLNIVDTSEGPNVGTANHMNDVMIAGLENNIDNATGPEGWFEDFVAEEEANS